MNPELINKLTLFRRELHQNPEVSENEWKTRDRVAEYLRLNSEAEIIPIGITGLAAIFDSGIDGETIMLRAELDALPIQEVNDFSYRSINNGVSHKCGHDGHTTILCGVAEMLSKEPISKGKVILLFQPAEENGEGAKQVYPDFEKKGLLPDKVFALHNLPGYPAHQIVVKNGSFTPAVKSIIITLDGKTSHAAEPENGLNPAAAMSEVFLNTIALSNNNPDSDDFRLVTPVFAEMGEKAHGISAGKAEVHLTFRSWTTSATEQLALEIEAVSKQAADKYGLTVNFSYLQEFDANMNNQLAVDMIRNAATELELDILEKNYPFKWGEDFGYFTTRHDGAMFGLGAGENVPALHNPDYDFPDEVIKTAVLLFMKIVNLL
ncbi:amidohydrolase [Limibacter armeniacum]|uniref:amidohydrolase n=1 Tax=Limibacter armeniacum TaxID=466084 RepID=UPI002FE50A29